MTLWSFILWFSLTIVRIPGYPQQPRTNVEDFVNLVTEPQGTITSTGYPNGYTYLDSNNWKFRVPEATSYTLLFTDIDLDWNGCYDYITIYDDNEYLAPGRTLCEKPLLPVVVSSPKISVNFVTGLIAGARGAGFSFSYAINGEIPSVTTTTTATNAPPMTTPTTTSPSMSSATSTVPPISSTIVTDTPPVSTTVTDTPMITTTATDPPVSTTTMYIPVGGYFPPSSQDDSTCGNPATKPQITGFDYEAQAAAISGYQLPSSKVVNGEEAVPHSWPWQASIQASYGSAYCGGTLVKDEWVVTAAHCAQLVYIGTYSSDRVVLGMHDKRVAGASQQLIDIVEVFIHPQYDTPDRSHDVALLKLKTPAVLNDDVSLACEAPSGWVFPPAMRCVVTGWGVTVEGGVRGTNILQQAPLPLLSDQDCYDLYQQANLDTTSDMQCAGGQGKGACNGESGGPLNCYVNNRWYHMGIVSFGEANCDTEIASVFARVAQLRGFIDDVISTS